MTKKKHPERVKVLLNANKLKLNHEYSIKYLPRLPIIITSVGIITLALSNQDLNQNSVFGWSTITQGGIALLLSLGIKNKHLYNLLIINFLIYVAIWGVELLSWGIPNDLLDGLGKNDIQLPSNRHVTAGSAVIRMAAYIFPYVYLTVKAIIGFLLYLAFHHYQKFHQLPQDIKEDLNDFN